RAVWRGAEGPGGLHGPEGVNQAGALVGSARTDVTRGAHDDLLHQRRRRRDAAVRCPVGLYDQSGHPRSQRGGLAGAAEGLYWLGGGAVILVGAFEEDRGVGGTVRPTGLTGGQDGDGAVGFGDPGATQSGYLVTEPALALVAVRAREAGAALDAVGRGLLIETVIGAGGGRDHAGQNRRRADGVGDAGVAGADDHGDTGVDGVLVGDGDGVGARVRDRVAAEGLAEDVNVVDIDGVVDALQDLAVEGEVGIA